MSVGNRVWILRRRAGLSQTQLTGDELSKSYLSLIESGKRQPPGPILKILARRLGCSVHYLVTGVREGARDTLRADLDLAESALDGGDAVLACARFGHALTDPDLTRFTELEYRARIGHALALEAAGDLADAAAGVLSVIAANPSVADAPDRRAEAHLAGCRVHRRLGDLDTAARVGETALAALTGHDRPWTEPQVRLAATLLAVYVDRGDHACARSLARRMITESDQADTRTAWPAAGWKGALRAYSAGDHCAALRFMERATAPPGPAGGHDESGSTNLDRVMVGYAECLLRSHPGQISRAAELIDRAQHELAGSAADPVDRADCDIAQARLELHLGRPDHAADRARHAIDLLTGTSNHGRVLAEAHIALGAAYVRLKRPDDAVQALSTATRHLTHLEAAPSTATTWAMLAEVLNDTGDTEREAAALLTALDIAGIRSYEVPFIDGDASEVPPLTAPEASPSKRPRVTVA